MLISNSAESQGVVAGCVYLIILFLYIPIQFMQTISSPISTDIEHYKLVSD